MRFRKIIFICFVAVINFGLVFASPDENYVKTEEQINGSSTDDAIGSMLLQSLSLIGIPYKWGGNTPETGLDCSGYIRYVYQKSLGITLPRTAAEMSKVGKRVNINELEPGDLLFFNTHRGSNTHVGMYIGNNKFIQSPRTGDVIRITELNSSWRSKLNGAKRIVQENVDENGEVTVENYQYITDEALPGGYTKSKSRNKYARRTKKTHKTKLKAKKSNITAKKKRRQ